MSTSPPCFSISGENYCANNITLIYYSGVPDVNNTCTIETCSLLVANFKYLPNLTGNSIFVAIFTILFLISLPLGIIKKTWGYMAGLNIGIVLEVVGYGGRIMGHSDPFSFNAFLIYLILLTIGPAFLAAAIYLCLARIIVVYGAQYARFKPRTYSIVFMCSDFLALVLQGAGGGIASTASDNRTTAQAGVNIMIAGLAWQVVSLSAFAFAAADYAIALRKGRRRDGITGQFHALTETRRWTIFLWSLGFATLAIYVRSVYRVAELSQGFDGTIANYEIPYMILEGAMVIIACVLLTASHPALVFGHIWRQASPRKLGKGQLGNMEVEK